MSTDRSNPDVVPTALFGGLTVLATVAAGWFGLETYLLAKRKAPITWYVRNEASNYPARTSLVVALVGFAVGAAVTHFIADESRNP